MLKAGDVVSFRVLESKRTGDKSATELSVVESSVPQNGENTTLLRGTVILKKDSYGFIESGLLLNFHLTKQYGLNTSCRQKLLS